MPIKIKTYIHLIKFIEKFKEGHFDLLIIMSKGGLGKTFNVEKILTDDICGKINSHITPLGLFQIGYEYKDKFLWFDDVEALFNSDKLVGLMKQFAQTQPVKEIMYVTSKEISTEELAVPKRYKTESKILMTCNSIQRIQNEGIKALLDRGIQLNFEPSFNEIISYIKKSFENIDKKIIEKLRKKGELSLRDYIKHIQLKKAGFEIK